MHNRRPIFSRPPFFFFFFFPFFFLRKLLLSACRLSFGYCLVSRFDSSCITSSRGNFFFLPSANEARRSLHPFLFSNKRIS
ncbi:hypothetical protein B0T13DRAFT_91792 [Neurospora crassa]|nr:hypothetical protein B0T13DRAFT_91792 [Neurospora crassa]